MTRPTTFPEATDTAISRWQRVLLLVGFVASALCVFGAMTNLDAFLRAYLVSYLYWWMVATGCLGLAVLHRMTSGNWGDVAQPVIRAGIWTLPLIAVAFLPIAIGLNRIYPWADPSFLAHDHHAANRRWFLSSPFFLGRSATYLVICLAIGTVLTWRRRVFRRPAMEGDHGSGKVGGISAVFLTLAVSFAAIDWGMTLDPHWISTLYGGIFVAGALLLGVAIVTAVTALLIRAQQSPDSNSTDAMHDLGKLLLAFVMVWTYFEFSQFLIIYSGNLPAEAIWYHHRLANGWNYLAVILVVFHFAVPFGCLLSRDVKRNPARLATVAVLVAAMHAVKLFWTVAPSFEGRSPIPHWLDVATFAGVGALWLATFLWRLRVEFRSTPSPLAQAIPS